MRLFTAIPFPKEIKDQVSEIARGRLPIPYINTTNLHITLNFFGELDDAQVARVKDNFLQIVSDQKGFEIEFEAIVKFHLQLHLTVKQNSSLLALQNQLEKKFEALGFQFQDRNFYPHVKLGNLHMDNVMNRERKMENFPNQELSRLKFRADRIVLFESKLLLHHPKHIPLMEKALL
jgi:2'-5' RNA ligase